LGLVDPEDVERAICDETVLVSVMAANNEIGTLQPLAEVGEVTREKGVLFHSDAAQALGYLDLDVERLGIDLLSGSGHKIYGPKGVGFLYVSGRKPRVNLLPQIRGGGHERGMRSGTLNVPGIVGLSAALRVALRDREDEVARLRALTDHMWARLHAEVGGVRRHGHGSQRLPNNLNVGFEGVRAKSLVVNLPELAFSTGSACSTAKIEPSHVLRAIGLSDEEVREGVRFGLGRHTTQEEVDRAVDLLKTAVRRMRSMRGVMAS
jgi:cysteine desulfurase